MLRRLLAVTCIACSTGISSFSDANAGSRFLEFASIGLSTAIVSKYVSGNTCANARERNAGAAGAAMAAGAAGAATGALFGVLLGGNGEDSNKAAQAGFGALLGGFFAKVAVDTLQDAAAERAQELTAEQVRDYGANYDYNVCQLLLSSDKIRAPLIAGYLGKAPAQCRPQQRVENNQFSNSDWDRIVICSNNNEPQARELTLALINLNQATCAAIKQLYDDAARQAENDPRLRSFAGSYDPQCQLTQARQVWGGYMAGRQD